MGPDTLVDIAKETIYTMLIVVAPVMISSFVVGLLMSFLQAIFQIHEHTFSFVPKLLVIMFSLILYASWMIQTLVTFSRNYLGGFYRFIQ
jgi:flagellar biosynthetic protein FliQ